MGLIWRPSLYSPAPKASSPEEPAALGPSPLPGACPVSCLESGHCTDASHVLHAVSVLMVTLVTSPQRGPGSIGQGWICGH